MWQTEKQQNNMKASFENSVSVLVRAYMNDTLEHCNCYACAVGNLVADVKSFKYFRDECGMLRFSGDPSWFGVITPLLTYDKIDTRKQIEEIGYSTEDVIRIEDAFEFADPEGDWMFNGLMAVVDVLADIHGVDLSVKETAIGQFKEVQALKLV